MEIRYPVHQDQVKRMTTDELREHFHVSSLFEAGQLKLVYSHIDRVIVGGAVPKSEGILLAADKHDLAADFFLERREVGIINIGGPGAIRVDDDSYALGKRDCLYVGQGRREVIFTSADAGDPAQFYLFSAPAHASHPTALLKLEEAAPARMGNPLNSNERTIYKYIHPDGVQSCQIVMGMTLLEPGSMWNTMPAHLHARRMEAYLYFDMEADHIVIHLMGKPGETRHLVMRDREAVISPSWSIHSGMGTGSYTFIWAMAGENQAFSDMDPVPMAALR
ncbi:MAG TPA: 5-dehydro-4-deoxy-D-glucuronate isomerase [Candidatus Limnocylindrales bacterium]|nr:5-dehydro-4-deoxy-D-glucuronate isomerase [Candidatus Limnocylindrales bacterium]